MLCEQKICVERSTLSKTCGQRSVDGHVEVAATACNYHCNDHTRMNGSMGIQYAVIEERHSRLNAVRLQEQLHKDLFIRSRGRNIHFPLVIALRND